MNSQKLYFITINVLHCNTIIEHHKIFQYADKSHIEVQEGYYAMIQDDVENFVDATYEGVGSSKLLSWHFIENQILRKDCLYKELKILNKEQSTIYAKIKSLSDELTENNLY